LLRWVIDFEADRWGLDFGGGVGFVEGFVLDEVKLAAGAVGLGGVWKIADDFGEDGAEGGFVFVEAAFPIANLSEPFGAAFGGVIGEADHEAKLFHAEFCVAEFFGEDDGEAFAGFGVVGIVLKPGGEAVGFVGGFAAGGGVLVGGDGFFKMFAQGRKADGAGGGFVGEVFAGAGNLFETKFRHVREVRAGGALDEEVEGGAGGDGIFGDLKLPVGKFVTGQGNFDGVHRGIIAKIDDDFGGVFEAVIFGGVKFGEHHPALEIIFFEFELVDDFEFGVFVFAKFHFANGFAVGGNGRGHFDVKHRAMDKRHEDGEEADGEHGPRAAIHENERDQKHGDADGENSGAKFRRIFGASRDEGHQPDVGDGAPADADEDGAAEGGLDPEVPPKFVVGLRPRQVGRDGGDSLEKAKIDKAPGAERDAETLQKPFPKKRAPLVVIFAEAQPVLAHDDRDRQQDHERQEHGLWTG
jgi:hypothetical protein